MKLLSLLESPDFTIFKAYEVFKHDKIKQLIDELVSRPEGYSVLKENAIASNNFFSLLSHVYLIEQNKLQVSGNMNTIKPTSIPQIFSSKFNEKISELTKSNETSQELFK